MTSSDTSVATVQDNKGTVTVTIVGAGTTDISVGFAGGTDYSAASDTFTLTVDKAQPTVKISADPTSLTGSATVKLTDKSGTVTKVLGPLTPENTRMLLMSVVDRDRLWTLSKDGKVAVHLNIRQSDKPIADGKVSLVAYNDVVEVNDGSVWPADTRFLARPET